MENNLPDDVYGAGMPLLDKVRLLVEWAPLLARFQTVASAKTPHDRAVALVEALQWAAGKTPTQLDDDALEHVEAVLKTPEGQAAFDWFVKVIGEAL